MYNLIIAGGRDLHRFMSQQDVNTKLIEALTTLEITTTHLTIADGGATGGDAMGAEFAKQYHIPTKPFPAKWDDLTTEPVKIKVNRYGKEYNVLAGFNRNTEMLNFGTHLIAFWDGKSKGTKDMIDKSLTKYGEDNVHVIHYK